MNEDPPKLRYSPGYRKRPPEYHEGYRKGYATGKRDRASLDATDQVVDLRAELDRERKAREAAEHRAEHLWTRLRLARDELDALRSEAAGTQAAEPPHKEKRSS